MAEHAVKRAGRRKTAAAKSHEPSRREAEDRPTRIVILTADPHRKVVIVPGCHLDSLRQDGNAYFFEDGNELVGMIVEGGTVEFDRDERAYIVRLTDGRQ
jgi:hypothetical protein